MCVRRTAVSLTFTSGQCLATGTELGPLAAAALAVALAKGS